MEFERASHLYKGKTKGNRRPTYSPATVHATGLQGKRKTTSTPESLGNVL
jgi:hypothetical protein